MFEIGKEYGRSQLLAFVGSKQKQSGIIWGPKQPGCVIVTSGGRNSKSAGYKDIPSPDGSWAYFGQGSKGNQDPEKYANKLLAEGQRSILLFTTREPTAAEARRRNSLAKRYRFEGMFGVRAWELYTPDTGRRAGDQLLLFHLLPARGSYGLQLGESEKGENEAVLGGDEEDREAGFTQLRASLLNKEFSPPARTLSSREYRKASTQIKKYARLSRAFPKSREDSEIKRT